MTPIERALRQLAGTMLSCNTKHASVSFSFGTIVAEITLPADDRPPLAEQCPCGHDLSEHSGGGCLLGCSDSRCDARAASVSQLEQEVFAPLFAARSKQQ